MGIHKGDAADEDSIETDDETDGHRSAIAGALNYDCIDAPASAAAYI